MSSEFEWNVRSPLYGEPVSEGKGSVCLEEHAYMQLAQVACSKNSKLDVKSKKALSLKVLPKELQLLDTPLLRWMWSGKNQWLVMAKFEREDSLVAFLQANMKDYYVSEQTGSRVYMTLSGDKSRDVLMKLCKLDLDESVFIEGSVVSTNLGHINVHLCREIGKKEISFGILVFSSLAKSLWHEIREAGLEYGMGIKRFYP